MRTIITGAALAIAIAAFATPAPAGMFDVADKLESFRIKMVMAGKDKAEAKACTERAFHEAFERAGKLGKPVEDFLDAELKIECNWPPEGAIAPDWESWHKK